MKLPKDLSHVSGLFVGGEWLDIQSNTLKQESGMLAFRQGGTQEHLTFYINPESVDGYRDNHKARQGAVDAERAVIDADSDTQRIVKEQQANALARAAGVEGEVDGDDEKKKAAAADAARGRAEAMSDAPPPTPDAPDASYGTDGPATMRRGPGPDQDEVAARSEAQSKAAQGAAKVKADEDARLEKARHGHDDDKHKHHKR